ncbi:cutinase family protein [Rhodococcus hoagii]|nr:cutinase family protein [Prescottella equi]NKS71719.1 cutinase family protein [Prescottella equi]
MTIAAYPATAAAAPGGCPAVEIVSIPGTWETNPQADPTKSVGMLAGVTDPVKARMGDAVKVFTTNYVARAFDGMTYADSKQTGIDAANSEIAATAKACPGTKFALFGYSQGADAAGDIAADIGAGAGVIPPDKVLAVGLLADPSRGTSGESRVGPPVPGTGITGARPQGFGALVGRVATICEEGDKYCATPRNEDLLRGVGAVLGTVGVNNAVAGSEKTLHGVSDVSAAATPRSAGAGVRPPLVASDAAGATDEEMLTAGAPLVSDPSGNHTSATNIAMADLGGRDLGAIRGGVQAVTNAQQAGDLTGAATAARGLESLLTPAQSLVHTVSNSPIMATLDAAPPGSVENTAGQVLRVMSGMDFAGMSGDAAAAIQAAGSGDVARLATAAAGLASKSGVIEGLGNINLGGVTNLLASLQPAALMAQGANIIRGLTTTDFIGLLNALAAIPAKILAGDLIGIPDAITAMNRKWDPIVQMLDNIDLKPISSILLMFPFGSEMNIAGQVISVLDRIPVRKLANTIEATEQAIVAGDLAAAPQILGQFANIGVDVANLPLNFDFTNLPELGQTLDLGKVVTQATSAATFYASGAHTAYPTMVVDQYGRNAIQWLSDWCQLRVNTVV